MRWRLLMPIGFVAVPAIHAAYAAQYLSVEQAQRAAFPAASSFVPVELALTPADRAALEKLGPLPADWSPQVWQARAADRTLGWLYVDQVIGKTREITYALAIGSDGAVASLEILEYRESHGSEVRLAPWRKQFAGKTARDPIELNRDIQNISGATLSCRHVTDGVRRLLELHERLPRPAAAR